MISILRLHRFWSSLGPFIKTNRGYDIGNYLKNLGPFSKIPDYGYRYRSQLPKIDWHKDLKVSLNPVYLYEEWFGSLIISIFWKTSLWVWKTFWTNITCAYLTNFLSPYYAGVTLFLVLDLFDDDFHFAEIFYLQLSYRSYAWSLVKCVENSKKLLLGEANKCKLPGEAMV